MTTTVKPCRVLMTQKLPRKGGHMWFAVDCECGWSSPWYGSAAAANRGYSEHKGEVATAFSGWSRETAAS